MNSNSKTFVRESTKLILDAIRAAVDDTKHHQQFGKGGRFENALRKRLGAHFVTENLCINVTADSIRVWGCGISYNDAVSLYGGIGWAYNGDNWAAKILREVEIHDHADLEEREAQELAYFPQFVRATAAIIELQKQIEVIRRDTLKIFENMPEPTKATVRKGSPFWGRPTHSTSELFPALFS